MFADRPRHEWGRTGLPKRSIPRAIAASDVVLDETNSAYGEIFPHIPLIPRFTVGGSGNVGNAGNVSARSWAPSKYSIQEGDNRESA